MSTTTEERVLKFGRQAQQTTTIIASIKLGIPDLLFKNKHSSEQIALKLEANTEAIHRLLRCCSAAGFYHLTDDGFWEHTEESKLLITDEIGYSCLMTVDEHLKSFQHMEKSAITGKPVFPDLHDGLSFFEWLGKNPKESHIFNMLMIHHSLPIISSLVHKYNWRVMHHKTLIDVGGGAGHLIVSIVKEHPEIRGIILEIPHVIEEAKKYVAEHAGNLVHQISLVPGSIFTPMPKGDGIIMKHILHAFGEQQCEIILENCRQSLMPSNGKLFIVENVINEAHPELAAVSLDATMLVITGGKERNASEWNDLLLRTGFKIENIVPISGSLSLIEASTVVSCISE